MFEVLYLPPWYATAKSSLLILMDVVVLMDEWQIVLNGSQIVFWSQASILYIYMGDVPTG